ncbi:MAG: nickel pincer cofactor biosynthesis protein LarB [Acidimicrobiales bacterium]
MPVPDPDSARLGHSTLDSGRFERIGIPEAVYAEGKTTDQCVEIVEALLAVNDHPVVVTRADTTTSSALARLEPDGVWGSTFTWRHRMPLGAAPVAIVSGGTSDQPVVDECRGTLVAMGAEVIVRTDVGVAGLHRLLDVVPALGDCLAIVAIAGMEASLPTVLAGLVAQPIIAVPTSAGYGSSLEGVTASLALLASCAPGIGVVGIDNGYGAACSVLRILSAVSGPPRAMP